MFDNLSEDTNPSLIKFEQMLKTNQVLFFDALEFENYHTSLYRFCPIQPC